MLAKSWPASCLCPSNSPETKLKSRGLVSLVEAISRQHNIESVTWLILISLKQLCNENDQTGQKETQTVEGGGKEHHERVLQPMLVQPYLEEGCEGGVLLLSTKIKGGTPSGQNLTHVSFQLMEEQKAFSAPRKQPIKNSAVNVFRGPGSAEMAARCDGSIHVLALEVSWPLLCFRF